MHANHIPTEKDETKTQENNKGGEEMPLFASVGDDESMGPPNESEEDGNEINVLKYEIQYFF
jgi:hypothetical protein